VREGLNPTRYEGLHKSCGRVVRTRYPELRPRVVLRVRPGVAAHLQPKPTCAQPARTPRTQGHCSGLQQPAAGTAAREGATYGPRLQGFSGTRARPRVNSRLPVWRTSPVSAAAHSGRSQSAVGVPRSSPAGARLIVYDIPSAMCPARSVDWRRRAVRGARGYTALTLACACERARAAHRDVPSRTDVVTKVGRIDIYIRLRSDCIQL
jgi:hypothetical protein